jgi:hypothetical protein
MPRHSLDDKNQEWHVLDLEAKQKDRFAADVAAKNPKLAALFRKQAVELRAKRDRINDLIWRDVERIDLDKQYKSLMSGTRDRKLEREVHAKVRALHNR